MYAENRKESGNTGLTIRNDTHKYMRFSDGTEQFYKLNTNELETSDLLQSTLSDTDEIIKNELISKMTALKN